MDNAFDYVQKNAGIDTEEYYPYIATTKVIYTTKLTEMY